MRLRDLGERGLISRIERAAAKVSGRSVVLGIGDDAALLRPRAGEDVVVSTDASVENVHFRFSNESPRNVGRRALVANLSDLAAMGARPMGFVLALGAPGELLVKRVDGLVAGLLHEAVRHGCPLIGGNCSQAGEVSLAITALGAVKRGNALTRRGVRAGDRLLVTGVLGAAALDRARAERRGRVRHVAEPRLRAGLALTRVRGVGSCIDISDGLEADLGQVLDAAGLAADLEPAGLPLPRGFRRACAALGLEPLALALGGGEDYELLFTLRPRGPSAAWLSQRLGVAVTEIGRVVVGRRQEQRGWRHFAR
ncbi:MAG: thiamine-phosphate kinase [Myxococcota bacterium]|nr:thiamine-phosphate kinase [Deltaproteobacteria bacterium]MCP4240848.1 thiamine-phosphate kinase [bacterium]MDP6075477.1 thiamine-phosphate kinase [Myxococcota bacterium]MDP6243754.1 thiamine-phosphate kinase [Myxococcota bacterium]MDP7075925.1 thiamine-phosphate kinase [Myxococcota bacterium]